VGHVTLEVFRSVRQAELEADAIIRDARAESARIRDEAAKRAEHIVRRAMGSAEQQEQEYGSKQMALAEDQLRRLRESQDQQVSEIRRRCDEKKAEAVSLVIERIVRLSGDR